MKILTPRLNSCIIALLLVLSLAVSCGPDPAIKYYNEGVEAATRDDFDEAIRLWKEALKHRPDDAETHYNLGLALLKVKRYSEAEMEFLEATILNPDDHEAQYGLGKSLEMQGELMEARNAYERSIHLKPNYVPSLVGLAWCALKKDQNRSAERYASQALTFDFRNEEANLILAEALFRIGNYQDAHAQLLTAQKFVQDNPKLHLLMGKITYARHMYIDAIESLKAARSAGIANPDVFLYLGLSTLALEKYNEAETYFRLSIYKDEHEARAWKGLGDTYAKMEEWDKAYEAYSEAEGLDPDDFETTLGLSVVFLNTGRFNEAVQKLQALEMEPERPSRTFYYLGHAYMRLGRNDKAAEKFKTFLEEWKGDPRLSVEVRSILETISP